MSQDRENLPYTNVRSPSHTVASEDVKITRRRNGHRARRGVAAPLSAFRLLGDKAPVSVNLRIHTGAEVWIEVRDFRGSFWIRHDASVVDLIHVLQRGGYSVQLPREPNARS